MKVHYLEVVASDVDAVRMRAASACAVFAGIRRSPSFGRPGSLRHWSGVRCGNQAGCFRCASSAASLRENRGL